MTDQVVRATLQPSAPRVPGIRLPARKSRGGSGGLSKQQLPVSGRSTAGQAMAHTCVRFDD